jgi:hypothetical protein
MQMLLALGSSYEVVENLQDPHWKVVNTEIRNVDLVAPERETKVQFSAGNWTVMSIYRESKLLFLLFDADF